MGAQIGPTLGRGAPHLRVRLPGQPGRARAPGSAGPAAAQRFELYADGIELANGFHELTDAAEQRARFAHEQAERARRGLPVHSLDERLLAALAHGLPDCAGVALGFDRTLMLATGAEHIDEVLPFPTGRA